MSDSSKSEQPAWKPPKLEPGQKPGDHPDFFRFPAPPGRSRESKIVLDRAGRFWNDGVPIEHQGMADAFSSWISRHPDDGRYVLTNQYDWTYFEVEDAPFFVKRVRTEEARAVAQLSDGTEEPLDVATVLEGQDGVLYARVKCGEFEARFTPSAQAAMVDLVVEGPGGEPCIEQGGEVFFIKNRPGTSDQA